MANFFKTAGIAIFLQLNACGTADQVAQLHDDTSNTSVLSGDYLYDGPIRITRSPTTRLMGPTPALFRDHLDERASVDFPWNSSHGLMVRAAGDLVTIAYERLPGDDGQSGDLTSITLFYRYPGNSTIQSKAMEFIPGGPFPPGYSADITTSSDLAGVLEFWFEIKTSSGAKYWDSRYGRNYGVFLVASKCALISFDNVRDGIWPEPRINGTLQSGGALCLAYDEARAYALGLEDVWYRGVTIKPSLSGWAEFFDAEGKSINNADLSNIKTTAFPIPSGTARIALWYKGTMYSGRSAWDSRNGEN